MEATTRVPRLSVTRVGARCWVRQLLMASGPPYPHHCHNLGPYPSAHRVQGSRRSDSYCHIILFEMKVQTLPAMSTRRRFGCTLCRVCCVVGGLGTTLLQLSLAGFPWVVVTTSVRLPSQSWRGTCFDARSIRQGPSSLPPLHAPGDVAYNRCSA